MERSDKNYIGVMINVIVFVLVMWKKASLSSLF